MFRYIGRVYDGNLNPYSDDLYAFESIDAAAELIRTAGRWVHVPLAAGGESGAMLLNAPSVYLYPVDRNSTARIAAELLRREIRAGVENYATIRLETGPRGGVVRAW